jgi:hypothetical protein
MEAIGALPTEDRVKRMNDHQWLWAYFNVQKDEEEEEQKWKTRLDYMGWWANPQLAKSVAEHEHNKREGIQEEAGEKPGDEIIVEGDKAINDDFENELKLALKDAGMTEEEFTELPDSHHVGNDYESQRDFLSRVASMQQLPIGIENEQQYDEYVEDKPAEISESTLEDELKNAGVEIDDVDFFEYPDE